MKAVLVIAASTISLTFFGCGSSAIHHGSTGGNGPVTGPSGGGGGSSGGGGSGGGGSAAGGAANGGGSTGPCTQTDPNVDGDMDGYTPAQGDCNDCNPLINPGAVNIPGDPLSYDCSGNSNPPAACDSSNAGKKDATSIAQAIELCDPRFITGSSIVAPSVDEAHNILANFGILKPQKGANMVLLSNGVAVDETGSGFADPQQGTDLSLLTGKNTSHANPLPNLKGSSNAACGATDVPDVNDYTEVDFELKAPTNAKSFSFQFQFFSGEYPDFVCSEFNDEFLAIVQSKTTYPTATNISFDSKGNPLTVNSGFFTVCDDGGTMYTNNCTQPPSNNQGDGYETGGGSTGWLSTTAPINPGETFTLKFAIFDESDYVLDTSVLIDNFQWGLQTTTAPVTNPITRRIIKHHKKTTPAAPLLMCLPA